MKQERTKTNGIVSNMGNNVVNRIAFSGGSVLTELIKSRVLHVADVSIISNMIEIGLPKVFKHIPDEIVYGENDGEIKFQIPHTMFGPSNTMPYIDFAVWNNVPIIVWCKSSKSNSSNDGENDNKNSLYLITLNNHVCVKTLNMLIKKFVTYYKKYAEHKWSSGMYIGINRHGASYTHYKENVKLRNFDDVFVTKKIRDELKLSIDNFISKKKWYKEKHIPYHFGILLYSEPGTGKSSLAQAICSYAGGKLLTVPGDDVSNIDRYIVPFRDGRLDKLGVILIEDIDCGMDMNKIESRSYNYGSDKGSNNGLANILNTIDGVDSVENVIYIFTTNHIDKLDPALIRPGRIDLKIEVGNVCAETLDQFCKFHYGKEPHLTKVKPGLSFAQLQVEVMKNKTYDELIKFVTE